MGLLNFDNLGENALLQAGLGILANNQGHGGQFAPAFGQGTLQGLQQASEYKRRQQEALLRQQQMEMQKAQYEQQNQKFGLEQQKYNRETADYEATNKAIANLTAKDPQMADLLRIDPKSAIKSMYPNANGADPYTEVIYDDQGKGWLNNRRETDPNKVLQQVMVNGNPFIGAKQSPELAGRIKGAEAQNQANWKPNTDIEGRVLTDAQVARQSMNEGGIAVPTKAESTTAVEQAKANVGLGIEKAKNVKKADQFLTVANQAKLLLNDSENKPTHSGFGAGLDAAGNLVGVAPSGANEASRLEALSGWMVSNVPRMEGPQSNFDVQNYQTMAGMIGDRTKPLSVRQNALNEVIKLQEKYKSLNQDGNIMPSNETMPKKTAPKSVLKGQVYKGHKFLGGDPSDQKNWVKQ